MHFVLLFTNWLPDSVICLRIRGWLASFFFKKCGKNLRLGRNITFYRPYEMELGDNIYIAMGCWFNGNITIENDILFGPLCMVVGSNHTFLNGSFRFGPYESKGPLRFGKGSWIAGMCTILTGAEMGSGCLLASNSVLNSKMPEYTIFGGTPARQIGLVKEKKAP